MSEILIYHHKKDKKDYNKFANEILQIGDKKLCNSDISKEFLEESLDLSEYLFIHMFQGELRGFACVYKDQYPQKHLYINLICNVKFHSMKTRNTKELEKFSGKDLINSIIDLGKKLKVKYIELNAIKSVITYYYRLGFGFKNSEDQPDDLIKRLNQAQQNKDEKSKERLLKKIVGKHYDGFYNEKNQKDLGSVKSRRKMVVLDDYGIPMVYYLKQKSPCKGKTVKKCTRYNKCKVARGSKRVFCRTKRNSKRKQH